MLGSFGFPHISSLARCGLHTNRKRSHTGLGVCILYIKQKKIKYQSELGAEITAMQKSIFIYRLIKIYYIQLN